MTEESHNDLQYDEDLDRWVCDSTQWESHRDAITAAVSQARAMLGDEAALDALVALADPETLFYRPEDALPSGWTSEDGYCADGGEGYEVIGWSPTRKAILRNTPPGYRPAEYWIEVSENTG